MISAKTAFMVKRFRDDYCGEYRNKKMTKLCERLTTYQDSTFPYNPKQNSLAAIREMVRCTL
jgi:hypothetical protein